MDFGSTLLQSQHRESPGITERVQHLFSFRIGRNQFAVFPLIDEEAGFLSFFPVDSVGGTIFLDQVRFSFSPDPFVGFNPQIFGKRLCTFVVDTFQFFSQNGPQCISDFLHMPVHSNVMCLNYSGAVVIVDNQSRKQVPFAMD